jgi:hypothetical protein
MNWARADDVTICWTGGEGQMMVAVPAQIAVDPMVLRNNTYNRWSSDALFSSCIEFLHIRHSAQQIKLLKENRKTCCYEGDGPFT